MKSWKQVQPVILSIIGAAGVVGTSVMAVKATPKALELIESDSSNKHNGDPYAYTKSEAIASAWKCYIPAAIMGVSTIACIMSAAALSRRSQASITSAYAMLNESYKRYRNKLVELHGKEADEEIRESIVRDNCNYHQIGIDIPDEKILFIEPISGETIERYEREIMDAEYHINRNFILKGYVSLNEFYEFLGLPKTKHGEEVGWSMSDGYYWIDFEHSLLSRDDGGTPVYEIDYIFEPDADYLREWQ